MQRARFYALTWVATALCLLFFAGLPGAAAARIQRSAPTLEDVEIEVERGVDLDLMAMQGETPLAGAVLRAFAMIDDQAYLIAEVTTGEDGRARIDDAPAGEIWFLGYAAGMARSTASLAATPGQHSVTLTFARASPLAVLVKSGEEALPGAKVLIQSSDPIPHLALAGPNGIARFDRLGSPPFTVIAEHSGYAKGVVHGVFPGEDPTVIDLDALGTLVVRVVDGDRSPVSGATVHAGGAQLWPSQVTTTNDLGEARIVGLDRGAYSVRAEHQGEVSPIRFVHVERGASKEIELVLAPGRTIEIEVVEGDPERPDAQPVSGAHVVLAEEGISPFPFEGITDKRGIVVLGPVGPTSVSVSVRAEGYVPSNAIRLEAEVDAARIGLRRGGRLFGRITDEDGYPVDAARLEVVGVDPDGMPVQESAGVDPFTEQHFSMAMLGPQTLLPIGELGVMPGPIPDIPKSDLAGPIGVGSRSGAPWVSEIDGTYEAIPVTPGRHRLLVRHPEYVAELSEWFEMTEGGEVEMDLVLRRGGLLEGRVVEEDGFPVADARVSVSSIDGAFERVVYSREDGTFQVPSVPRDVLILVARGESILDVAGRLVAEVEPNERTEVEIMLSPVRDPIVIRVVDGGGYPLESAQVTVHSLAVSSPLKRTAFSNESGLAQVNGVDGLPLRIVGRLAGYTPRILEVQAAPDELTLMLDDGALGFGEITAEDGRDRIEGASITLHTTLGPMFATSDAEGAFEIRDVPHGPVWASVAHPSYATLEEAFDLVIEGDRVDLGTFDLSRAGTVTGYVMDAEGYAVEGARVGANQVPAYLPMGPLPDWLVTTGADGAFKLGGVPVGEAVLEAYHPAFGRAISDVVFIEADREVTDVSLVITEAGVGVPPPEAGSLAVTLGERDYPEGRRVTVFVIPPGSEADIAGIQPLDRLLEVNGRFVRTMRQARDALTGPMGEDLLLKLARDFDGQVLVYRVRTRRERMMF